MKHIREYAATAERLGLTGIAIIDRGGRHPAITGEYQGRKIFRPLPRVPRPKHGARRNWAADLKRQMQEAIVQAGHKQREAA